MKQTPNSDVTTEGIRVQAAAQYLEGDSLPEEQQYAFAYKIVISNVGDQPAQLIARHWEIIDADNHREFVDGPGVVGETPRLAPGESHDYVSGCPLPTPWGTMEGHYVFQRDDGSRFNAKVGRFFLVAPQLIKKH